MKRVVLFFGLLVGIACVASAQSTPVVRNSQARQSARIADGIQNGELTYKEAKHLKNQQKHIQHQKHVAKADGVVTHAERKAIRQDQRIANRSIKRQKHDGQTRM